MCREEGRLSCYPFLRDPCTSECRKLGGEVFRTWRGREEKGKKENSSEYMYNLKQVPFSFFSITEKGQDQIQLVQELAFLAIPVFPDFPLFSLGIHRALEASGSLPVAPLGSRGGDGDTAQGSCARSCQLQFFQTCRTISNMKKSRMSALRVRHQLDSAMVTYSHLLHL